MNVIISQALATGLPVITTRHSGLPDQVVDGKNGFLIEERDFKALAEKILYMIEHPEIWGKFGIFGRKHIKNNYDFSKLIERQIKIYKSILFS